MTKIAIIKNGSGIEQYFNLKDKWKDNSIELIWDINEISKRYRMLMISITQLSKDRKYSAPNMTLFDLGAIHRGILQAGLMKCRLVFKVGRIIIKEKPDYIVVSNFQFLFIYLIIYKLLRVNVVLNFSRAEQLNSRTALLIRKFKINNLIAPGIMAQTIADKYGLKAYMRIPRYPVSFFTDIPCSDIPEQEFLIAFIGRLIKPKGIYEFIHAAIEIAEKHEKTGFIIIGDGPEKEMIIRIVSQANLRNRIFLLGYKNNIEIGTYLRKANAIVVPSYTEGFSKVWYEAILTGTPIILTKHSGIEKLIVEQVHGLYIKGKSIEDIKAKILKLYEDPNLCSAIRNNLGILRNSEVFCSAHTLSEIIQQIVENQG